MNFPLRLLPLLVFATLLAVPIVASASDALLLKLGLYVGNRESCKDAPNAAILVWDGKGFSGAHSSQCSSRVTRRGDGRFNIMTTCSAIGDGSPNSSQSSPVDTFVLNRLSPTRFELIRKNQSTLTYRWCSAASSPL